MKFKQNIGIVNALVRIICGLTILSWATAKLSRKPWKSSYLVWSMLGAMKVGEGILKYCPVTDALNTQMKEGKIDTNKADSDISKVNLKQWIDIFIPKEPEKPSSNYDHHEGNHLNQTHQYTTIQSSDNKTENDSNQAFEKDKELPL